MKSETTADNDRRINRRQALAGLGALGAGGGAYLVFGARGVQADVTVEQFDVADGDYEATDGTVYSPWLVLDLAYEYSGVDNASELMLAMLVDETLVTSETFTTPSGSYSDTHTLKGAVIESRKYSSDDWNAPDGGSVAHTLNVEVRMEVRSSTGDTLVSAKASDSTTVTVSDAGPSQTASLGGSGTVEFQESQDDPEP